LNFPFFLFGNKKDKEVDRSVPADKARAWAKQHGIPWEETSALESLCIEKAFDRIAHIMLKRQINSTVKYVSLTQSVVSTTRSP